MNNVHKSLRQLRERVNVTTRYPFNGNQLAILYDDHRWILNVLFKIQKESLTKVPPKLVFFDSHDDYAGTKTKSKLLEVLGVESLLEADEKSFSSFVDFDVSPSDGNWLSVACELNLISDAVVIGNKYGTHFTSDKPVIHTSEDGSKHHLFMLSSNLDYELGDCGALGDRSREQEFKKIRQFFDIHYENGFASVGKIEPFLLDFDLDFFTLNSDEESTVVWPQNIWKKHYGYYNKEKQFVQDLMMRAEVITICREPDFCGEPGFAGANYILQNLDRYFFDGHLGTSLDY